MAFRRSTLESFPSETHGTTSPVRACLDLFLISFLILFFELACIRWFGSTVIFLTFFTNIVLMACFLGVSVGCLAAGRRVVVHERVRSPDAPRGRGGLWRVLWAYQQFSQVMIDVGRQQSPQLIYFGTDARREGPVASSSCRSRCWPASSSC